MTTRRVYEERSLAVVFSGREQSVKELASSGLSKSERSGFPLRRNFRGPTGSTPWFAAFCGVRTLSSWKDAACSH